MAKQAQLQAYEALKVQLREAIQQAVPSSSSSLNSSSSSGSEPSTPDEFVQTLIQSVIKRLSITIENVHIRLQGESDDVSLFGLRYQYFDMIVGDNGVVIVQMM